MSGISEKLEQKIKTTSGISSEDVARLAAENESANSEGEESEEDKMNTTSIVEAEKPEDNDSAMRSASAEMDRKNLFFGLVGAVDAKRNVEITPVDKQAFVDSVVSNSRMTASYSFFGGKLTFKIRSRTYEESRAAIHFAYDEMGGKAVAQSEFSMRLRAMLMSLQIAEMNGVVYDEAEKLGPLFSKLEGITVIRPKWLERVVLFERLPEAVFEAVWQCVYEFESKYWTLMRNARNQDFWLPG